MDGCQDKLLDIFVRAKAVSAKYASSVRKLIVILPHVWHLEETHHHHASMRR